MCLYRRSHRKVAEERRRRTRTGLGKPDRLRIAQELVQPYQFIVEIEEQAEKQLQHLQSFVFHWDIAEQQRITDLRDPLLASTGNLVVTHASSC